MPAIIAGFVKVVNMNTGGVASFGDTVSIMPKNVSKGYFGAGFSLTGDFATNVNEVSNTNTTDIDVMDANIIGKA
ncbi:MAG: spore germination protein [Tumebacillaceae bacterium]